MLDPVIMLILVTALVSAFNPYTLSVLLMLSSVIYGRGHASGRVFGLGLTYILTLLGMSILGGIAILYLLSLLPLIAATYLALGVGILIVCAGLLEIKDFFWYGQGISIHAPHLAAKNVKALTKMRPGLSSAVTLGFFVAIVSTPSSSAPYFATITLLGGNFTVDTISLVVLYSVLFILPMFAVLIAIASGAKVSTFMRWKEDAKDKLRLAVGLLLIALGWMIILTTSGVLNFR
ncbi:MAG TPA: hypothetical protein VJM46_04715 [Candidatus Saccharimonadales bacterium]|nr:hypothetical protein [Candidatus Saccharimonadales bacterium]